MVRCTVATFLKPSLDFFTSVFPPSFTYTPSRARRKERVCTRNYSSKSLDFVTASPATTHLRPGQKHIHTPYFLGVAFKSTVNKVTFMAVVRGHDHLDTTGNSYSLRHSLTDSPGQWRDRRWECWSVQERCDGEVLTVSGRTDVN